MNLTIQAIGDEGLYGKNKVFGGYFFCSIVFCLLIICTRKSGACKWDLEPVGGSNPSPPTTADPCPFARTKKPDFLKKLMQKMRKKIKK